MTLLPLQRQTHHAVSKHFGCHYHDVGMNRGHFVPKQSFRSEAAEDLIAEKSKCTGPSENLVES